MQGFVRINFNVIIDQWTHTNETWFYFTIQSDFVCTYSSEILIQILISMLSDYMVHYTKMQT